MKPICNILVFSIVFFMGTAHAQTKDSTASNNVLKPIATLSLTSRYSAVADFQTGSGSVNQYVLNRFLFGGYISPEQVNTAEKRLNKNTRAGLFTYGAFDAAYVLQSYTKVKEKSKKHFVFHGLGIGQQQIVGASFSADLFRLAMQGNAKYSGQKLETGVLNADQWNSRTLYISGERHFVKDSLHSKLDLNLGVSQLLTYRKLRVTESWLYTDADVQYIDAFVKADLINTPKSALSGNGLGLVASAQYIFQICKSCQPITVNLDNVGIYKLWNSNTVSINTPEAVSLKQTNISYAELRNGYGINQQRDSLLSDLNADTVSSSRWVASPFRVGINFKVRGVNIASDYTYISGYLPRVVISPVAPFAFNFLNQVSILPQLQLGGFDTYNLNVILGYKKLKVSSIGGYGFSMFLKLYGLEGMIVPKAEHGSGIMLTAEYSIFK